MAAAMGFAGFGKKAREFDVEKLAEQTRKQAEERNRQSIGKYYIITIHFPLFILFNLKSTFFNWYISFMLNIFIILRWFIVFVISSLCREAKHSQ